MDYYCAAVPVLGSNPVEALVAAVCLQVLSVDLWLQVLVMAANFKGLVGSVPTSSHPYGPFVCTCAQEERQKMSSWVISHLACVCTSLCVYVSLSSGFNRDLGRVSKLLRHLTPGRPLLGEGDENKA